MFMRRYLPLRANSNRRHRWKMHMPEAVGSLSGRICRDGIESRYPSTRIDVAGSATFFAPQVRVAWSADCLSREPNGFSGL
jgi:hypothetical protein